MFMIKNLIISTDYLNNSTSETVSVELEQLTSIYSGRIVIVDSSYTIIKDTYVVDEKKTCISENVLRCFDGEEIVDYDSENNNINIALLVTGNEDNDRGVIFFNL